jgi:hypothetical protein
MTLVRRHHHFSRQRFRELVATAFPDARFGSFEAHYVPGSDRLARLQDWIEDGIEKLRPLRPILSYNFAVAGI